MPFTAKAVPQSHCFGSQTCGYHPVLDASERFLELMNSNVYNKSAKGRARMDGTRTQIIIQEAQ